MTDTITTLSWTAFAITTPQKDTAFDESVLTRVWDDVKDALPRLSQRLPMWTSQAYFYVLFMYLNFMPTVARFGTLIRTKIGGTVSYSTFRKRVWPIADVVAATINYISWDRCLAFNNHHRLFPYFVTGIVDGFPVRVQQPVDKRAFRLLNQGKYKFTCLKGEMIISLTGEIIAFTFPFIGTRSDSKVGFYFLLLYWDLRLFHLACYSMQMRESAQQHTPFHPHETLLGDKAYIASKNVLTGYVGTDLSGRQRQFNRMLNGVRQRVSQVRCFGFLS